MTKTNQTDGRWAAIRLHELIAQARLHGDSQAVRRHQDSLRNLG